MKTKIILVFLCFITVFSSCDLDEEPYGFYSEDNFYKTADDAEAAVCYAYDALTFLEYSRAIFYLGDIATEECSTKSDESADNRDLDQWKVANFKTNGTLTNYFKYAYIAINRANAVIKKIPDCTFDQALKDQYLGEAYFLRAWNYFNLARNFGLVPLHTSTVETLGQTTSPLATNLDEIYDLILSDCKKAESLLGILQALGRADKVAVQSLAAKVYLTIASAKEHQVKLYADMNRDVSVMYDSVAYYASQVVDNQSVYGFDDDLLSIYDVEKPKGKEHIFLLSMDRTGDTEGDYSKISKMFIPYIDGATIYLDNKDGSFSKSHDGWSVYQTTDNFYNSYDNADKRKTDLIVDEVYDEAGVLIGSYSTGEVLYPFTRKYIDPDFIGDKTSTKPYLIRFSDIALVYAEAVGPTAKGYELVNYIRQRAGLGNLPSGLSMDQFRERVLEERSWELAFEGDHLYDLRRYKRVTDVKARWA